MNRSIYTYAVPQRGIEGRGTRQSAVEEPKNDAKWKNIVVTKSEQISDQDLMSLLLHFYKIVITDKLEFQQCYFAIEIF